MSQRHKTAVQTQFTKTADAFSTYAVRDTPEVLAEKVDFIKPQPADLALDVACGPGTLVLALAPRVGFARGIDLTEIIRDPSHTLSLRLTTFVEMFEKCGLEIARQALKRRQRSFNQWMLRAGLEPSHKRYQEVRKVLEESIRGDRAGFSPEPQGDDILITHNEGMF